MPVGLAQLHAAASGLGVPLDERALARFDRYLGEILHWRRRINLTSASDAAQVISLHFVDALLALSVCDFPERCRVADVGSGAGLPGIPIKIARPHLHLTLIEASRRRVAFLEHVRVATGLDDLEIEWARAEEFGRREERREEYDRSVERATARLSVAAELCLPLVRPGGAAVFLKGPRVLGELEKARPLIAAVGGEIAHSEVRTLPTADRQRAIVVINKVARTPSGYPRSAGRLGRPP